MFSAAELSSYTRCRHLHVRERKHPEPSFSGAEPAGGLSRQLPLPPPSPPSPPASSSSSSFASSLLRLEFVPHLLAVVLSEGGSALGRVVALTSLCSP